MVELLPLVGIVEIFDALNAVSGSCLRGQGMQYIGSIVNLVVYNFFAIPLGLILASFLGMKLYGLWIGIGSGMLAIGLIQSYYVLFPNWGRIMDRAEKRRDESETDSEDDAEDEDELLDSVFDSDSEETPLISSR